MNVNLQNEQIEVPSQEFGGVLHGTLLSYFQCPRCQTVLRLTAVFEDEEQASVACQELQNQMGRLVWESSVEAVAGTASDMGMKGVKQHGVRYSYGWSADACEYLPYYGTERELAKEVWERLRAYSDMEELPSGPVDMSGMEGVVYAKDQCGRMPPLLLHHSDLTIHPFSLLLGRETWRFPWDEARELYKQAPGIFLRTIRGSASETV